MDVSAVFIQQRVDDSQQRRGGGRTGHHFLTVLRRIRLGVCANINAVRRDTPIDAETNHDEYVKPE